MIMMIHAATFTSHNKWEKFSNRRNRKQKQNFLLFFSPFPTHKIEISMNDYFPWDINYIKWYGIGTLKHTHTHTHTSRWMKNESHILETFSCPEWEFSNQWRVWHEILSFHLNVFVFIIVVFAWVLS